MLGACGSCGGQEFRPISGEWICIRCGEPNGLVRPFKRLRVAHDDWFGSRSPREPAAVRYRQRILHEARRWSEENLGTVRVQIYRRPELVVATVTTYFVKEEA